MQPIIDHIQITVKNLQIAEPFYDKFLAILGFDINLKKKGRVAKHEFDVIEYSHPLLLFGINSPRKKFKDDTIHRENREHYIILLLKLHRAKKLTGCTSSSKKQALTLLKDLSSFLNTVKVTTLFTLKTLMVLNMKSFMRSGNKFWTK